MVVLDLLLDLSAPKCDFELVPQFDQCQPQNLRDHLAFLTLGFHMCDSVFVPYEYKGILKLLNVKKKWGDSSR